MFQMIMHSLKEQLKFIHFDDEDVLFKVYNINQGYQLQQIAEF